MGLLPAIPVLLLVAVAIWFFWPIVIDPIMRASVSGRRDFDDDADQTANLLFDAWAERS